LRVDTVSTYSVGFAGILSPIVASTPILVEAQQAA
jgi:hypothetical protein